MQGRRETMMAAVDDLVEAARQLEMPPQGTQDRVRTKLACRIASGAAASAAVLAMASEVGAASGVLGEGAAAGLGVAGDGAASTVGAAASASMGDGVAAAVGNATAGTAPGGASVWLTAGIAKVVAVSVIVIGGTGAGGWYWSAHRRGPMGPSSHTVQVGPAAESAGAETGSASSDESATPAVERGPVVQPVQPEVSGAKAPRSALVLAARPSPSPSPSSRASGRAAEHADPLPEELALLRSAQRNLDSGQIAAAKADLRQYVERFPSGMLRAEYHALRVLTLCAEGDKSGAELEIQRLKRSNPDSPVLRRLRQGCPKP